MWSVTVREEMQTLFRLNIPMMITNLQINALAAVVILLILANNRNSPVCPPENRSFRLLLIHLLILLALDSAMWSVNLQQFPGARILNLIVNYAYYAEQSILGYLWGMYSHRLTRLELTPQGRWLHRLPLVTGLATLCANPMTQSVFVISADNVYSRGWGILGSIYAVCAFFYLIEAMLLAVFRLSHLSDEKRKDGWNLLVGSALPVLGAVLQMLWYGVTAIWSFGALSVLILYLNVQSRHAAKAEKELEQSRISVMLSQIQPHFLYNALLGIKELCDTEPEKASDALEHFSYFLRGNLDSLTITRLIPFTKELEHIEDYLYLEKMRYEERIEIEWQIEYKNFMLPPLTLQPIIENAVRHGITKKNAGGKLTIRTEQNEDSILITVRDDGAGFDINEPKNDGKTHIGIENVRKRLEMMCGGALIVKSEKEVGTEVTIILPQRRVDPVENYSGGR